MKITTFDTPDGPFTVLIDDAVVLASGWTDSVQAVLERIRPEDRPADIVEVTKTDPQFGQVRAALGAYYGGDLRAIDQIPVRQFGTEMQLAGWQRLRSITPGAPLTYTGLAQALGKPSAVRAAARICARNAPALFVPCHRVLRTDGNLGGFAWGLAVKESLLAREANLS